MGEVLCNLWIMFCPSMFVKVVIGNYIVYSGEKFDSYYEFVLYKDDTVVASISDWSIKSKVTLLAEQVEFLLVTGTGRKVQVGFAARMSKHSCSAWVVFL